MKNIWHVIYSNGRPNGPLFRTKVEANDKKEVMAYMNKFYTGNTLSICKRKQPKNWKRK
jgi:hypothetical protein